MPMGVPQARQRAEPLPRTLQRPSAMPCLALRRTPLHFDVKLICPAWKRLITPKRCFFIQAPVPLNDRCITYQYRYSFMN